MPVLSTVASNDLAAIVNSLHDLAIDAATAEECAQRWCFHLYDNLLLDMGDQACALVRCFRTSRYAALSTELRDLAAKAAGSAELTPTTQCLVLMGSAGQNPDWNSRHRSQGHRVIPLPSSEMIIRSPMIAQLFRQLGVGVHAMVDPSDRPILEAQDRGLDVFYVRDAVDSPYIPAQEQFVVPYRVHSVIGFGGVLPSGSVYAFILFTKAHVPEEVAARFQTVATGVKDDLAALETRRSASRVQT